MKNYNQRGAFQYILNMTLYMSHLLNNKIQLKLKKKTYLENKRFHHLPVQIT